MGVLKHLPGTALTPAVVLHRTLAKVERIKAIAVIIQWDDESYDSDWSQQKVSELCMGSMVHDGTVRDLLAGGDGG